jgi:hypothetical protein
VSNDANPPYNPSQRFDNVNALFSNHYRFVLAALPDLTFFLQSFTMPSITTAPPNRANPFVKIPEVADHLDFSTFGVSYMVDNSFKSYFSLFYWLKGYGFPTSYQDIEDFDAMRRTQIANPRPMLREIQKTTGVLTILQPDIDTAVAEVVFDDVFPTSVGELPFETVGSEPSYLTCRATFAYTNFNIRLTNS